MPPHYAKNVQQRQPVELLTDADVDQAFTDASMIFKRFILKAMNPKVTRQDVDSFIAFHCTQAIKQYRAEHDPAFDIIGGALKLTFEEIQKGK